MEKLSINIAPEDWGDLITKYNADTKKVTPADFTDGTINIDTDVTGSITKRKGGPNYNPSLLPAAPKDQFEAIFTDGARHLLVVSNGEIRYSSGDTVFNTVVNGTGFSAGANFEFITTQDRVYGGNAVNSPIVYDRSTSYGGVTYTAPRIKTMGAQAPGSAPTVAVVAGGSVPVGAHTYKVTFLYYDFEESNGGPASAVATTTPGNQTVNLTAVAVGGYGVTARKIYRDDNDGLYLHVGTIANNTATTFSDTVAVGATPTEIPEFNNVPPTFGLIVTWLDKQWLGKVPGDPSTLFYTETGMPEIVRPENQILCNQEDPITAYVVYFGRLVVFNRRSMGQILGTTPDTFRYSAIPSSVGCVDNRTLQTRVIEGVPVLIWLSDRGFYSYDGNSINYISDVIEDLVNFNIQQAVQQKNANSQTNFSTGTPSNGIDSTQVTSLLTTRGYLDGTNTVGNNPRRDINDNSDFALATSNTNIQDKRDDNYMACTLPAFYAPASGSNAGTIVSGFDIKLPLVTTLGGETTPTKPLLSADPTLTRRAMKFIPSVSGTVSYGSVSGYDSETIPHKVYSHNAGTDLPNAVLGPVGSVAVSAGTIYWLVAETIPTQDRRAANTFFPSASSGNRSAVFTTALNWVPNGGTFGYGDSFYTITTAPSPASGTWTSLIVDTKSSNPVPTLFSCSGSFPSGTSGQVIIDGSNDPLFISGITSQFESNPTSSFAVSNSGKRYYRIRIVLNTPSNIVTPVISALNITATGGNFALSFDISGTWISEVIDHTADVTVYDSLTSSQIAATGFANSTITITISTSADNLSYTAFVAFGSHVVQRYSKIKVVIAAGNATGGEPFKTISSRITDISILWTLIATFLSPIIDTAVAPPAGWDIFLSSFETNGGTVSFQMRSAASSGGIPGATFFSVTPNDFPNAVTPLQFVQWKVFITSANNDVPTVDSVTVQWFISSVNSIRPASIFVDSRYYVALAGLNQTINDILLELDLNGKWRRHRGLSISTFSYFFNRPYFGIGTTGQIRKFLEGFTDAGSIIEFDVRTKAFDYSTNYQDNGSKVKVVGEVILQGINTGATFEVSYSVDGGTTFIPMRASNGALTYISATDEQDFFERFRPVWDGSTAISGRTIIYRVYTNDLFEAEIKALEAVAFLRKQAPVITG